MTRDALVTHIAYCHEAVTHCASDPEEAAYWQLNAEAAEGLLAEMDAELVRVAGWVECFGAQVGEVVS